MNSNDSVFINWSNLTSEGLTVQLPSISSLLESEEGLIYFLLHDLFLFFFFLSYALQSYALQAVHLL